MDWSISAYKGGVHTDWDYFGTDFYWHSIRYPNRSACDRGAAAGSGRGCGDSWCDKETDLFHILLPALFPAVMTGFSLAFARALGEYGSVVFIAGNIPFKTEITPLMIMSKLEQYDYHGAAAIACLMLLLSFFILLLIHGIQWYVERKKQVYVR